ncbi:MAG TPA: alpha/beta hydrolase [Maritimibacter sp.]|nr:alpha/beta hydrolase [Maritimibacter sp.]
MKEPVLLVPGMMSDARAFGPQIAHLSTNHVVQIANVSTGISIREIAAEVIHNAPPRFALCGLAMGGMVAMEILRRVPERVTRLCLISTSPHMETPDQAVWREPQIVKAQAGRLDEAMEDMLRADNFAPGPNRSATITTINAMGQDQGPDVFIRQSRALQRRPDAQKVLSRAQVPTLVMCGAHDRITPVKRHSFMAELIPWAELVVIDDAGHMPTLETPEKANIALAAWMELPLVLR